jgi:serine/threonine protein kinase
MAPEVIENKDYTLKADVFSFGIIIWEICSRKTPYSDMTQQQISYYVTVKKGRPDKTLIPHNAPPAVIFILFFYIL